MKRLVDSEVNTLNTRIERKSISKELICDSASKTDALRDEGNVSLTSGNGFFEGNLRWANKCNNKIEIKTACRGFRSFFRQKRTKWMTDINSNLSIKMTVKTAEEGYHTR